MKKMYAWLFTALLLLPGVVLQAQDRTISGKITAASDNAPIPGANVIVKGTTTGTISDANGEYSIGTANGATLVFSFIGFSTKEVAVPASGNTLNVTLTEDVTNLEEVVVTGLASSIKRSNLANAVTTLNAEELVGTTRPVTLDQAMNGKIVGANIVQNSGAPGGGISVKLRGISSINGSSEPLYIVDGIIINNSQFANGAGAGAFTAAGANQDQTTNRISDLNPADIENIEVLKGPSAAAIYGTRANAGVVIITTKRGQAGKTKVSIGQDIGFARAWNLLGSSDWDEAKIAQYGGFYGVGEEEALEIFRAGGGRTWDYEKIIYGNTGVISNTRLSISGGNDKTKFYVSGGLNDETGIQKRTGFGRRSIRANLDHKLTKFIDFSISSSYTNSDNQRSFSGNDNNGVSIGYTLGYIPNFLDLNRREDGSYPESPGTGQNPLEIVDRAVNDETTNRFLQSATANIYLLQNSRSTLKLSLTGGVDFLLTEGEVYMPDDLQFQLQRANPGASRFTKNRNLNTYVQAFLGYNWKIGDKLSLNSQVGTVRYATRLDQSFVQGEGLPSGQNNPRNATVRTFDEFFARWQDVGVVLQQEANFEDKIIATAGMRWDKSSLNGYENRWYGFPRASLAVNVAKFGFWNVSPVSQWKLRAAYGQTGGVPVFGNTFTSLPTTIIGGQLGIVTPTTVGNPIIEPETAQEIEVGTDIGLFNNRVLLEATLYDKTVFDLINPYIISPGTGVTQFDAFPVGDLQNRGVELGLTANPVNKENFFWTTTVQYWFNRSKITRLDIPNTLVGSGFGAFGRNQLRLGESPTRWYGTPNVPDANGVPQLTVYEDAQPRYQISFSNNFRLFKNFDFSFLLHTSQGNHNSNLTLEIKDEGGTTDDWSNDDDGDGIPNGQDERLFGSEGNSTRYFIQDASYIRLREVALYYTLPKSFISSAFGNVVQNIRVGASAYNLFTITDYYGYDPEVSNFGNRSVGASVDLASFPTSRRMFFHVAIDF